MISCNVSVHPRDPNEFEGGEANVNPLAQWMACLDRFLDIPGDPLVLPAHGLVFRSLYSRLKSQKIRHTEQLSHLMVLFTLNQSELVVIILMMQLLIISVETTAL